MLANLPAVSAPRSNVAPSDEALMADIAARQPAALGLLHARYHALLSKIIGEILSNAADTQETLQDVFGQLWRHAESYDASKGKPLGWIICLARRRAIDYYRKLQRRTHADHVLQGQESESQRVNGAGFVTASPEADQLATSDLRRALLIVMAALPSQQTQVLQLTYFEDLSQREIATRTGIPLGTIKTRLILALRKLSQTALHLRHELN